MDEPMNMQISNRRISLIERLKDKDARDRFVESHIRNGLSFQIRGTRKSRGWNQEVLAEKCHSKQGAVSRLENSDYGKFSLKTLRRLASVFDVALVVKFVPFSELLDSVVHMTPENLEVPSYDEDEGLTEPVNYGSTNVESIAAADTLLPRINVNEAGTAPAADHFFEASIPESFNTIKGAIAVEPTIQEEHSHAYT